MWKQNGCVCGGVRWGTVIPHIQGHLLGVTLPAPTMGFPPKTLLGRLGGQLATLPQPLHGDCSLLLASGSSGPQFQMATLFAARSRGSWGSSSSIPASPRPPCSVNVPFLPQGAPVPASRSRSLPGARHTVPFLPALGALLFGCPPGAPAKAGLLRATASSQPRPCSRADTV